MRVMVFLNSFRVHVKSFWDKIKTCFRTVILPVFSALSNAGVWIAVGILAVLLCQVLGLALEEWLVKRTVENPVYVLDILFAFLFLFIILYLFLHLEWNSVIRRMEKNQTFFVVVGIFLAIIIFYVEQTSTSLRGLTNELSDFVKQDQSLKRRDAEVYSRVNSLIWDTKNDPGTIIWTDLPAEDYVRFLDYISLHYPTSCQSTYGLLSVNLDALNKLENIKRDILSPLQLEVRTGLNKEIFRISSTTLDLLEDITEQCSTGTVSYNAPPWYTPPPGITIPDRGY